MEQEMDSVMVKNVHKHNEHWTELLASTYSKEFNLAALSRIILHVDSWQVYRTGSSWHNFLFIE